jgi:hypothetical protein
MNFFIFGKKKQKFNGFNVTRGRAITKPPVILTVNKRKGPCICITFTSARIIDDDVDIVVLFCFMGVSLYDDEMNPTSFYVYTHSKNVLYICV